MVKKPKQIEADVSKFQVLEVLSNFFLFRIEYLNSTLTFNKPFFLNCRYEWRKIHVSKSATRFNAADLIDMNKLGQCAHSAISSAHKQQSIRIKLHNNYIPMRSCNYGHKSQRKSTCYKDKRASVLAAGQLINRTLHCSVISRAGVVYHHLRKLLICARKPCAHFQWAR